MKEREKKRNASNKKKLAFLLILAMFLTLLSCGCQIGEQATEATGFASLDEVIELATENHKIYAEPNELENVDLTSYAINNTGLLTESEMDALRTERHVAGQVSIDDAKEDADLFFRTWKYAYSSYYIIGEELFENAEKQVMAELDEKKDSVKGSEFAEMLYNAMSFLRDCHSSINGKSPADTEKDLVDLAYIDQSMTFDMDENGYYQTYEDGKWYFTGASDESIRIEATLLENGKVVYCPIVLSPSGREKSHDTLTLEKDDQTKEVPISWSMCQDVNRESYGTVSTKDLGNVYYIDFLTMMPDLDEEYWGEYMNLCLKNTTGKYSTLHGQGEGLAEFLNTATEAKNYDAVIFDLRNTQGWTHWQLQEWIRAFTGQEDSINETYLVRQNALRTLATFTGFSRVSFGEERCDMWNETGHTCKNDIPLIILTDKSCGSSVEEACLRLRTIENSIVIGSNTAGCSLGGSVQDYYLPHSGVTFAIGGFTQFQGKAANIDGIGYEPDIWCDPENALNSAVALLQNAGIADDKTAEVIAEPVNLTLKFYGHSVSPGMTFGNIGDSSDSNRDEASILVDGEPVDDFEVRSGDESLMKAEKGKGNILYLTRMKSFDGGVVEVIVTYKGLDYVFNANDKTWHG